MSQHNTAPPTDEGWFALHDFRTIDWDAWREAPERERKRALSEIIDHLVSQTGVGKNGDGASAIYSILGHKADLLILHLRPTTARIGAIERQFERTKFAKYTKRATSFVSVTEASGYSERARKYFDGTIDENSGLANYMQTRLKPDIPDTTHVCFYPMNKRRQPGQNWYDLDFETRAEHMEAHGDIGRDYGGRVVQMITGAIALDDWEWGVTLWGDDLVDMKDLLYEMRFDPSTSKFAEFGSFYIGRRIAPSDLPSFMAGDPVPTDKNDLTAQEMESPIHPEDATGTEGSSDAMKDHANSPDKSTVNPDEDGVIVNSDHLVSRLSDIGLNEETNYGDDIYGLIIYSKANLQDVRTDVDGLRGNFDHYDTHIKTVVTEENEQAAVASLWETERAANIAKSFLLDIAGVEDSHSQQTDNDTNVKEPAATEDDVEDIRSELSELDIYAGTPHGEEMYALVLYSDAELDNLIDAVEDLNSGFDRYDTHNGTNVYNDTDGDVAAVVSHWKTADAASTASEYLSDLPGIVGWANEGDGFETMGMFYTVKPAYRDDFVKKFGDVEELLVEMEGHRKTSLLENVGQNNDMFIASRWDSKQNAMEFFRSDDFTDAVEWGREVLVDRPRHVFLT